jgi:serine phosphatase RsbU (regulator of sigma subunit)/anti-sigma regulatory factor (Ser/Thr protein kinase)
MPALFAPTIWLSGRLSFSRKFLLIGVVVLIALALLSQPLLQQAHRDKRLAETERAGLRAFVAQANALVTMVEQRSQAIGVPLASPSDSLQAHLAQILAGARAAGLDEEAERLQASWAVVGEDGAQADAQRRFATRTGAINALLGLIQASARAHRLNVDSRLDAVSNMLSNRLPLVLETLGKQRDALSFGMAEMASYALGAQVVLTESVPGLKTGVAQLAERDPASAARLRHQLDALLAGILRQQDLADRALDDSDAMRALGDLSKDNLALARTLLARSVAVADAYLVLRIQRLEQAQLKIAAILVGAIAAIAYLFAGIYLSTLRSLKSLSEGTAAFCSGRLDTRIAIHTKDELVLVARNFNSVATEFQRLLEVIREQNESRERELEELVQARTAELAESNAQLIAAGERVQEELLLARNMQAAILPQEFPDEETWSVHAVMYPARELGGDFYDCFALPDGRQGILIADVSGKGVGAAFFMAVSRTVLLDLAIDGGAPSVILARANDLLCERNPMQLFVTVFYGIYDAEAGTLVYASAGHHPPLLRAVSGVVTELGCTQDIALGLIDGMSYSDHRAVLEPGSALIQYTDGVTEAFSPAGQMYGDARLRSWFAGTAPSASALALVESLVADVAAFVDGADASDDLTCLVLCRKPGGSLVDTPLLPMDNMTLLLEHSFPSSIDELPKVAQLVDEVLADRRELALATNLCLEELIVNTVNHGLKGAADREIHIRLTISDEWLQILLKDDAPKFDPFNEAPTPNLDLDAEQRPIGGLGVHLIKSMMDRAEAFYDGSGNLIVLLKTLKQ